MAINILGFLLSTNSVLNLIAGVKLLDKYGFLFQVEWSAMLTS